MGEAQHGQLWESIGRTDQPWGIKAAFLEEAMPKYCGSSGCHPGEQGRKNSTCQGAEVRRPRPR